MDTGGKGEFSTNAKKNKKKQISVKKGKVKVKSSRTCDATSCLLPEGTKTNAPDHVEKGVKYEQTQQQVDEHGLWDGGAVDALFLKAPICQH